MFSFGRSEAVLCRQRLLLHSSASCLPTTHFARKWQTFPRNPFPKADIAKHLYLEVRLL
jgi:hypothetical protein